MSRLEEIDAFIRIAEAGSISRAAEQMRVAKSALSRRLSDLEARLGAQLFMRTTRRMSLTDAGGAFLVRARRILADLEEAEAAAADAQCALAGNLKIAAPLAFGMAHLKPVILDFLRRHERVNAEVDFSDRRVDLIAEGFDIAVRIGALADSSLIARKLCPIRIVAAAAPSFWERYGAPAHPKDLEALPYLAYTNAPRPGVLSYWGPGGEQGSITPPSQICANSGEFLSEVAAGGCGFVLGPTFLIHDQLRSGALKPALLDYEWSGASLHVVYPPTRQPSARVRAFADEVIKRFHNNPYWEKGLELSEPAARKQTGSPNGNCNRRLSDIKMSLYDPCKDAPCLIPIPAASPV